MSAPLRYAIRLPLGEELVVTAGARWVTLRIRRIAGDAAPLGDGLMVPIDKLSELRAALEQLERVLGQATSSEQATPG